MCWAQIFSAVVPWAKQINLDDSLKKKNIQPLSSTFIKNIESGFMELCQSSVLMCQAFDLFDEYANVYSEYWQHCLRSILHIIPRQTKCKQGYTGFDL